MNPPIDPPPDDGHRSAREQRVETGEEAWSPLDWLRSPLSARPHRLRLAHDGGDGYACLHFLARSGMPIPGCVVRRFLRRQSYAQSAWFVNRVQGSWRCGLRRILELGTDRLRWDSAGRQKRTVLARPRLCEDRHADVRSRRSCVWIDVGRWS
ncbi:MAG: hypothetical protein ACLP53_00015 [Isosphaeraceae bacterium]